MSSKPEQGLADAAPAKAEVDDLEVVQPTDDPAKFDLDGLVRGSRGVTVRVEVQPNGILLADVQDLAARIDAYPTDDDVPAALVEEYVALREQLDHTDVYVIEGRNSDWLKAFTKQMQERLGGDAEDESLSEEQRAAIVKKVGYAQIAAQIVQPEGVTAADVEALYERCETEADKLWRAMRRANSEPVKALMPDFSARVSRLSRRG